MSKRVRPFISCTLVLVVFLAFVLWLAGWAGGPEALVKAFQTSAPAQPSTPSGTQAPSVTSLYTLQVFFGSIQSADLPTMAALSGGTGAVPGITGWGSMDLLNFPGHTEFGPLSYQVLADNGKDASIRVGGAFYLKDPGGPPGEGSRDHYAIDGEARLTVKGSNWVVTALPNYAMTGYTYDVVPHGTPNTPEWETILVNGLYQVADDVNTLVERGYLVPVVPDEEL